MDNLAVQLVPEVQQFQQETNGILIEAQQFKITTADQFHAAGDKLMRIKGVMKKIDELFDPIVKKAFEAHKATVAAKKQLTEPLTKAETMIKQEMTAYNAEQRRIATEAEAKARELAEAQARKEREKLLSQAVKAEEKGQEEKAEALLEQAENIIPLTPIIVPQVEKVKGISTKTVWKAIVVKTEEVPAYFNGMELRTINQSQLNKIAQMTAGNVQISGVRFEQEEIVSSRAI